MKVKAQNQQEALLTGICETSWAAPFVFAPDEWRKGNATREPADLAWVCGNGVILIHTAESKKNTDLSKRFKVRDSLVKHNLGQLEGWMRSWKKGKPLCGTNTYTQYETPFSTDLHVIALSVIDCDEAEVQFHNEVADRHELRFCATVPQNIFTYMIREVASTLDFLVMMYLFRSGGFGGLGKPSGLSISEDAAMRIVQDYYNLACTKSGMMAYWPNGEPDDRFWEVASPLLSARSPLPSSLRSVVSDVKNNEVFDPAPFVVFNDLPLEDTFRLMTALRKCVDEARTQDDKSSATTIKLDEYDVKICVAPFGHSALPEKIPEIISDLQNPSLWGAVRPGPYILFDKNSGKTLVGIEKKQGPTQMGKLFATDIR